MLPDKFFIAGMPRCRTAWFSAYLSAYDGVTCHHERLNGMTSRGEFYKEMEAPGCIGNSDSGLFITDFQERWPDAPTVILLRDPVDCYYSLRNFLKAEPSLELLNTQYERAKALNGLQVEHGDINERLVEIHEYLGIPFDDGIANQFENLKVELREPLVNIDSYKLWNIGEVA